MRTAYAVILCVLLLLVSGCAQKVNDPADVQAVKKTVDDYAKAFNAGDADQAVALMTDKAIYADINVPVAVGKEAIRSLHQAFLSQFKADFSMTAEDVRVAGDLAVARGIWTVKLTPKAQGIAPARDGGSWIVVCARENDGSWKWDWLTANSNQPLPGSTADGAEEKALIQIEQDWAAAILKSDVAAMERILAKEWTGNSDGQVMNKAQALAEVRSGASKIATLELSNLSPHVFGDAAVVTGNAVVKGTYKGKDISGAARGTDFFVKRDGRWQAISSQNISIK